jgi:penicillin-binding protein 1A
MTSLRKIVAGTLCTLLAVIGAAAYWFYFYDGDLRDYRRLSQFAPDSQQTISDDCLGKNLVVIPASEMGESFRKAFNVAERADTWSLQIARSALCHHAQRTLGAHVLAEMRVSARLKRQFSEDQLFAIYANRSYFGDGAIGVEEASTHYLQKAPRDLTIDEAALLAGLVRAPGAYSLAKHPDRALARRNAVLQEMVQQGILSQGDAAELEAKPVSDRVGPAIPCVPD